MKRINVMVSDPAKALLTDYQKDEGHKTLDESLDGLLLVFAQYLCVSCEFNVGEDHE